MWGVSQSRRALHGCLPPAFANRRPVGYGEFHNSCGICSRFDVSGKQSPLFGKQARHAAANWELRCWNCRWTANVGASQANLQINQGRYVEADCMWRGFWLETGQYLCLTAWIVVILLVCVLNCVKVKVKSVMNHEQWRFWLDTNRILSTSFNTLCVDGESSSLVAEWQEVLLAFDVVSWWFLMWGIAFSGRSTYSRGKQGQCLSTSFFTSIHCESNELINETRDAETN